MLSDNDNQLAREFGVVYNIEGELAELYDKFGFDLKKAHGSDKAELPLAATYVIDTDGIIRYAFLDVDYAQRADPELVLQALHNL